MSPANRNLHPQPRVSLGMGMRTVLLVSALTQGSCDGPPAASPAPSNKASTSKRSDNPNLGASNFKEAPPRSDPLPETADRGIFPEFNKEISIICPSWLKGGPFLRVRSSASPRTWLAFDGIVLCEATPRHKSAPLVYLDSFATVDRDNDKLIDSIDLLRGAKKAVINGAQYHGGYLKLDFPGGDVPRNQGVCTDVIIRALRNAGYDLQKLLQEDIATRPLAYPMVKDADPHIDHRRVRTLLPYFQQAFDEKPKSPQDRTFPYFPGDIVFMNTMGDAQPEHMGVVSDRIGNSGLPLIINNWNDGSKTAEMDLLAQIPVTHRFRLKGPLRLQRQALGIVGLLRRRKLSIPTETGQIIAVTVPFWESSGGRLTRWKKVDGHFSKVDGHFQVRVGEAGLGQGRGLHTQRLTLREKREGDHRAPAGVFSLGTAFGRSAEAPYSGPWPYRATGPGDFWVDDPNAPEYNTWQQLASARAVPWSAEHLSMYSLGLVVHHNTTSPSPGAGSAIFLHPWKRLSSPTVGCTSMDSKAFKELLAWLQPRSSPVLLQVAGRIF